MIIEAWAKHRSWFYSAGIAILIVGVCIIARGKALMGA